MATCPEAYKDISCPLKHIIPPDFESLRGVPNSRVWPELEGLPPEFLPSDCDGDEGSVVIPTVDLLAPNAVELIGHACETWGAFRLTNHGIPATLLADVESQARRLFALPTHKKLKVLRSPSGRTGYGASRMARSFSKFLWHEGFTVVGSPLDHAKQLWPDDDHHLFCDPMEQYQEKMKALAHKLLILMLEWLQVSEQELKWTFSESQGALQLNSFPTCPEPKNTLGLAPHTDTKLLTILHQTDKGLQVFRDGSGWVTVSPVPGALVINLGNLMEIFSNGRFPSVMHRVFVNQFRHRLSMAYFYSPPPDSGVAPFAKFENPIYRSLLLKEYLQIRDKHRDDWLYVIRIDR